MNELPNLLDHPNYAAAVDKLAALRVEYAKSENELNSIGDLEFRGTGEDFADSAIDATVTEIEKQIALSETRRKKLMVRVSALKVAVARLEAQIPELHRLAVEHVGRAAAEQHSQVATEIGETYRRLADLHATEYQIRRCLSERINQPSLPGHLQHDLGERFCRPVTPGPGFLRF